MKESVLCLRCQRPASEKLYASLPNVVRCECGFVYTSPRMSKESLRGFYSQAYFENHSSEEMGYDNYVSDRHLVEKTLTRRLKEIQNRWGLRPGKLLDVGCATGFFLNVARQMGWNVTGVEISGYCCDYAKREFQLELHRGFFTEVALPDGSFNLITMWDYVEHSLTPDQDIERAFQLLAPGGLLVIATPDVGSLPAKIFKENWIGFKEYEHLYYFTKGNLVSFLKRSHFKILSTCHIGKYVSVKFFSKRLMTYSKFFGGLADKISDLPFLKRINFYCNPQDIIYIAAKKGSG